MTLISAYPKPTEANPAMSNLSEQDQPRADALNAIHDEAVKLLDKSMGQEVRNGIELIISLARYGHDIRTNAEAAPLSGRETK